MNKTIRSDVRRVLFTMLSKYTQKQDEHEVLFNQKMGCLQVLTSFIESFDADEEGVLEVLENLKRLKQLEEKEVLSHNKYLQEISSLTGG